MADMPRTKPTGYNKYVDVKTFGIAVAAFVLVLILPVPSSMLDVGVEYSLGKQMVQEQLARELFHKPLGEVEQWQAATAQALELGMMQGVSAKATMLKRDRKALKKAGLTLSEEHFKKYQALLTGLDDARFKQLMLDARELRNTKLTYAELDSKDKATADRAARNLKLCIAMVIFVVICFVTEAIPLPGVAFCMGLILVFGGVVTRQEVASMMWSDAVWFIMGSLMFATAFVVTGVDKRICLVLFRALAKPSVKVITFILILVIAPCAAFISDHALAAMFLPIAIILYSNSLSEKVPQDSELAKMLVICVAMACNIGGFGAPSGGARNVIIMTYLEDMFGISMSYGRWMLFGMPFVIIMMPVLWVLLNWRFKPRIHDLSPALATLRKDIDRMGGWSRQQVIALAIFLIMLFGWITESSLLEQWLGIRLGIGVLAVAGAVAYLLTGIVNWRDYQQKVDWGVVWLYAGATIFGKVLDQTGAAYWMARSIVEVMASFGVASATALLVVGGFVTAGMTQLMADGPAAAAVGPVTLNMAAVAAPGSQLIPFMGLITSCASSMAYLLIIGTPPNAIVYASGYLEPRDFLRVGIPCLLISMTVLLTLALLYWPLLGFAGLKPF
ncbi:MAG: DASS family sodium-coupled anion symporter [Pseudomonadota bacterium]